MIVVITEESLFRGHGTAVTCTASDEDGETEITFGGDYRAMVELMETAEECGEILANIEDWQVLSTRRYDKPVATPFMAR